MPGIAQVYDDLDKVIASIDLNTTVSQLNAILTLDAFYSAITGSYGRTFSGRGFSAEDVFTWGEQLFIQLKSDNPALFQKARGVVARLNEAISERDSEAGLVLQKFGAAGSVGKLNMLLGNADRPIQMEIQETAKVKKRFSKSLKSSRAYKLYKKSFQLGVTRCVGICQEDKKNRPIPQFIEQITLILLLNRYFQNPPDNIDDLINKITTQNILEKLNRRQLKWVGDRLKVFSDKLTEEQRRDELVKLDGLLSAQKKYSILADLKVLQKRYRSKFLCWTYNTNKAEAVEAAIEAINDNGLNSSQAEAALEKMEETVKKKVYFTLTSFFTRKGKTGLDNLKSKRQPSVLSEHIAEFKEAKRRREVVRNEGDVWADGDKGKDRRPNS